MPMLLTALKPNGVKPTLVQLQRIGSKVRIADIGNVDTVIVPDQNSQMTALSPDLPDDFRVGFREF